MIQDRFNDWLEERHGLGIITASTVRNYKNFLASFLSEHGKKEPQEITAKTVTAWYISRLKTGSASTVRIAHQILSGFMKWLVEQGDISSSPMQKVKPPRAEKTERHALTEDQMRDILTHVEGKPFAGLMVRLALGTGMRRGEMAALRWRDLDLVAGKIFVTRAIVKIGGCEVETKPKTQSGVRVISIPASLLAELRSLSAGPDDPLLLTSQGGRPSLAHMSRVASDVMKAVGLGDGYCLHSARHAHATQLLRKKMPVKAVSQRLGHSDVTTTLRTYAHVFASDDAELAEAMDGLLA